MGLDLASKPGFLWVHTGKPFLGLDSNHSDPFSLGFRRLSRRIPGKNGIGRYPPWNHGVLERVKGTPFPRRQRFWTLFGVVLLVLLFVLFIPVARSSVFFFYTHTDKRVP